MKCVQMLILLLKPEAVDGGAQLEGTNLVSALGSSSRVGFTRIPGPDQLLLCSCVTLGLSLTLSDLSFLKADGSFSLLAAESVECDSSCT